MKTKYVVICDGSRKVFESQYDFIWDVISQMYGFSRSPKPYTYSLKSDEIEDDPEYDSCITFIIREVERCYQHWVSLLFLSV